jgi:hypothetical protein
LVPGRVAFPKSWTRQCNWPYGGLCRAGSALRRGAQLAIAFTNPVYAARNRLASLRAIFHIKSDSTTLNNIAVPSGNRSSDRVLAGCGIGPFSSGWHTTKRGKKYAKLLWSGKHPGFFRVPNDL